LSNETLWVAIGLVGLLATFVVYAVLRNQRATSVDEIEPASKPPETSKDENKVNRNSARVSQDLRLLVLQTPQGPGFTGQPLAIVMDIAYPEEVVSLMASAFGDTSIYFSMGGEVIGRIGHDSVRDAATAFVKAAAPYVSHFPPVSSYPFPIAGNVRFYIRTPDAVHMAEAREEVLGEGHDPLSRLFYAGHELITQLRLVSGDFTASQELINALVHRDLAAVSRSLASGADVNACDPRGMPALAIAVSHKFIPAVADLLQAGADPDTRFTDSARKMYNGAVSQLAAANGSLEALELLATSNAKLNAQDATGLTPLMCASFMGNTAVVNFLVAQGVSLEMRDERGYTALTFAANAGKLVEVERLLAAGADPNARDIEGSTPIMFAAQHAYNECVRALLSAGADPHVVGQHGFSAAGLARQNGHVRTEQLLKEGAQSV
jgi:ankyrin repeat protein